MARRSVADENIRSLSKVSGGRSYAVTLPKEIVKALGWRERQKLVVHRRGKEIIIRDWSS